MGLDGIKSRPVNDLGYLVLDDFRGGLPLAVIPVEFVEAAHARVGFPGQDFMDGARSKQRTHSRTIPALVQPTCNLLGSHGSACPIAFTGQAKSQTNDVGLDGLNLDALLLFCSDNLDVEGSVPEWDDSSVGISPARVLLHRSCRGSGRFAGLILVDDSDELSKHVARVIFREGLSERDQFHAMLAQRLNG